ncbi:MAG TPA: hypothetical protein VFX30_05775 [bacterium]|nr:hypothetical protein [bacterium]
MRRIRWVAVPPILMGKVHDAKEFVCINEWTLGLALLIAFVFGWLCVRFADRYFGRDS